jgi:ribonucleases P/MRP protein subunit RPP40
MTSWAETWQMEFNIKKCKVMHFGVSNTRHQYVMNGQVVFDVTEEERDIGVLVSNDLKPGAH